MLRALVQASLHNRLFVLLLALILLAWGGWTARQLPVDVFPDLNKPTVTLMTEAGGLAPEEVEQRISLPLEQALNGLPGVSRVRSVSGIGLSVVYVEFAWGSDPYRNRQLVAERLGETASQLPSGAVPKLGPLASVMGEIMLIALPASASTSAPGNAMAVREYADFVLRPRLLAIPGVAQVIPIGGEVRQFRVSPNPQRLADAGLSLDDLQNALHDYASNAGGGFLEQDGREVLIRHQGHSVRLADLQQLAVGVHDGRPVSLQQVADVRFAAATKRGDAGFNGAPAVIVSVQKQPAADTLHLDRAIQNALQGLSQSRPAGVGAPQVLFRQADFISAAVANVQEALRDGALMVAIILFVFLLNVRTTLISLLAIPLSLATTLLVFSALGLSINVMTLGGLAIAIGELVDDALVDVENILRRLRQQPQTGPAALVKVVAEACNEVRSGVVLATLVVVLVFVPLFALPGIEGRLFAPLGVAYITAILASLLVALTVTPVLAYLLLPQLVRRTAERGDGALVRWCKGLQTRVLHACLPFSGPLLAVALGALALTLLAATQLPRSFLPPFNEGSLTLSLLLNPGTALSESNRIGQLAEQRLLQVPEVERVGRRTGRAELDEHAEGVHSSEIDVDLASAGRPRAEVLADIRARLADLPAVLMIGQPISHRLDHLLSGVRAQIAIKVYGDDLDTLRNLAGRLRDDLATLPGVADLQLEKQVLIPQQLVELDHARLSQYGLSPGAALRQLQAYTEGVTLSQVQAGNQRFDLVLRLPDAAREADALAGLWLDTPLGKQPLSQFARVVSREGPNQIGREQGRRRIVLSANSQSRDLGELAQQVQTIIDRQALPPGYFISLEGQFQAQRDALRLMSVLAAISLSLIFLVLYSRYRSTRLCLMIMGNIPMALVGGLLGLWLAGLSLSVASLVGLITLTGIATRNGILKISHYINLHRLEGVPFGTELIVRGANERLTPVLMTALTAALALTPLLLAAEAPGKEILHPVAVVIFGGLISATLLDAVLTPLLFWRWGLAPLQQLDSTTDGQAREPY